MNASAHSAATSQRPHADASAVFGFKSDLAGKVLARSVADLQIPAPPSPPRQSFDDSGAAGGRANCFRFRTQPEVGIALAACTKRPGKECVGGPRASDLREGDSSTIPARERLLAATMITDRALFTDQYAMMAACIVVESPLTAHCQARPCESGRCRSTEADTLTAGNCGQEPAYDAQMRNRPVTGGSR